MNGSALDFRHPRIVKAVKVILADGETGDSMFNFERHNNRVLIAPLLAGAWDSASAGDGAVVARLAGEAEYSKCEASLREFLRSEDAPLEREGTVWAIRAPVDVFVHLAPLLGTEHLNRLDEVAKEVFGEIDPALGLSPEDRPFARLRGAARTHSS